MSAKSDRTPVGDRVVIYKRGKKGWYQADYHYAGQHRRRSLKTSIKKIAIERATKLAAQIYDGTLDAAPEAKASSAVTHTKLTAAIEDYLATKKASGLRPKTLSKYGGTLTAFGEFAATKKATRVDQVSLKLFDAYRSFRSEQKVRGKTIGRTQMYHDSSLVSRFFHWCADRNIIAVNPLASQKFSRPTPKRKDVVLTMEQLNAILAVLPKRILAPVAVLAFGGMRSANCRNLMVQDVDLEGGWIYIRSREGSETKCGNEWKVPLHPRLRKVLVSSPPVKRGYFFTAPPSRKYPSGGHWISTKHLNDDFVRVVKKLGMPAGRDAGYTIHSLRHFFKSFCVSHGVPREYVDAWQGHASIRTASDLYVHTFDTVSQRLMSLVPFADGEPAADAGEEELNNES